MVPRNCSLGFTVSPGCFAHPFCYVLLGIDMHILALAGYCVELKTPAGQAGDKYWPFGVA